MGARGFHARFPVSVKYLPVVSQEKKNPLVHSAGYNRIMIRANVAIIMKFPKYRLRQFC